MKQLGREETFLYIRDKLRRGERVIAPRYGDGEYLLMTNSRNVAKEEKDVVGPLLRKALKVKNQFVCTLPSPDPSKGIWYKTWRYVLDNGGHDLYGSGAWIRWDFKRDHDALPYIFKGKVLIVAGYAEEAKEFFNNVTNLNIDAYTVPKKRASSKYKTAKKDLEKNAKNYDNILFAAGPVGKVLLAALVDKTEANLVDIGSLLPAILSYNDKTMLKTWSMGGYKKYALLDEKLKELLEKLQ